MATGAGPNKYHSTPRKVFDTYIDRMAVRRTRDLQDHRADFSAMFKRLRNLENQLTELREHVASHCQRICGSSEEE